MNPPAPAQRHAPLSRGRPRPPAVSIQSDVRTKEVFAGGNLPGLNGFSRGPYPLATVWCARRRAKGYPSVGTDVAVRQPPRGPDRQGRSVQGHGTPEEVTLFAHEFVPRFPCSRVLAMEYVHGTREFPVVTIRGDSHREGSAAAGQDRAEPVAGGTVRGRDRRHLLAHEGMQPWPQGVSGSGGHIVGS